MKTALESQPLTGAPLVITHPWRAAVRSSAVLVLSLGLTIAVLVALANVVDTWS